jgi:predicted metal-dependent hydrolase
MSKGFNSSGVVRVVGRDVRYEVVRSSRAKHIRLMIASPDVVRIVVPEGQTIPSPEELFTPHLAWIDRSFAVLASHRYPLLVDGSVLPYRGGDLVLRLLPGSRTSTQLLGHELRVESKDHSPRSIVPTIQAWYRTTARPAVVEAAQRWSRIMGLQYGRIAIKDTRSRWGSCSSLGNLNFSWRLLLAPPEVLEYVVIHELAHLAQHNHSPAFWAIVQQYCPDQQIHRRWLRQHGERLGNFLRPVPA